MRASENTIVSIVKSGPLWAYGVRKVCDALKLNHVLDFAVFR